MPRISELTAMCPMVSIIGEKDKETSGAAKYGTDVHGEIAKILAGNYSEWYSSPEIANLFSAPLEQIGFSACKKIVEMPYIENGIELTMQELKARYGNARQLEGNKICLVSYSPIEGWDTKLTLQDILSVNMFGPIQYSAIEQKMEAMVDDIHVTGTSDLILYHDNRLHIVDWKTTASTPSEPKLVQLNNGCVNSADFDHINYIHQAVVYGLIFYKMYQKPVHDFTATLCYIVKLKKQPKLVRVSYNITTDFAEQTLSFLLKRNREPIYGDHCRFCFKQKGCWNLRYPPIPPRI